MAGRRLLNLVRAKRLLLNLAWAGCRLLDLIRAIRRLINHQPYPGRSPPVQPCRGWRTATGRRLFNFVWADGRQLKLVQTGRRLLNLVWDGRYLLNLDRVSLPLLHNPGRVLYSLR